MKLETSITRTLRLGLIAIAALGFSIGLASGRISLARAQSDEASTPARARTMRQMRRRMRSTRRPSSAISSRATAPRRIRSTRPTRPSHRREPTRMPPTRPRNGEARIKPR